MQKRIVIKNHHQEIRLITTRCIIALFIMSCLILLLIIRLGFLQLSKHDLYTTLSEKNWLDLIPLEPTRGLIYDRNGVLIAENMPVFSLDLVPFKISNLPRTLADLAKIIALTDTDIAQFQKELKQHRRFDEIPLKLKLSEIEVARFYENQYRFPGALIKARLIRHYPLASTLSPVLGYVGRINIEELDNIDQINYSATNYIGKLGIENFYEHELHGSVGYEQAENDASGEPIRILKRIKPLPGKNLYLTIDSKLQVAAELALTGMKGAVVAIQPATGQILAMVSQPSYNPNLFVEGISNQDFHALQSSTEKPLYNRALRGLYPIASPIKPFIALQGLNSGVVTPFTTIFDPGWYQLPNNERRFHDWQHRGHGTVNLTRAIISSCDTYFFDLAHKLGIQRVDQILEQFGFGKLTGIDLDEEVPGILASPAWKHHAKKQSWYEGDTLNSGIGQGYMQTTPLQLANAVTILANRGVKVTPHLLLYKEQIKPTKSTIQLADKNYWTVVINAMQGVINSREGTGIQHFGKPPSYTVAAKTGTAQVYSIKRRDQFDNVLQDNLPERLRDHSLFVAFAPVDNPQIAIAVIVENSKMAASVARNLLDFYLLQKPIPLPSDANAEKVKINGSH